MEIEIVRFESFERFWKRFFFFSKTNAKSKTKGIDLGQNLLGIETPTFYEITKLWFQ